jgi:hypothetical protein
MESEIAIHLRSILLPISKRTLKHHCWSWRGSRNVRSEVDSNVSGDE